MQDCAQPFIDGALEARRKRPGMFCQEAAVEGQELGNTFDGIAREAHRARREQYIPWGLGEFNVAGAAAIAV